MTNGVQRDVCLYEACKTKQFTKLVSGSSVQEQEMRSFHKTDHKPTADKIAEDLYHQI